MLRKSILIGLYVLKNNRTMAEQKVFREGRKVYCLHMLFCGRLRAAQGNGGVFRMGRYGLHKCQWVNTDNVSLSLFSVFSFPEIMLKT